jgi:hypothetical protein
MYYGMIKPVPILLGKVALGAPSRAIFTMDPNIMGARVRPFHNIKL